MKKEIDILISTLKHSEKIFSKKEDALIVCRDRLYTEYEEAPSEKSHQALCQVDREIREIEVVQDKLYDLRLYFEEGLYKENF